jgi:hypothetical protein
MSLVIDFQGYPINKLNTFFFKEITIYDLENDIIQNFFIKTPKIILAKQDLETYVYLLKYHHQIPLKKGEYSLEEVLNKIPPEATIFIANQQKCDLFQKVIPNKIFEIESFINSHFIGHCLPSIDNFLHLKCSFDKHNTCVNFKYCSLKRAFTFANFLKRFFPK